MVIRGHSVRTVLDTVVFVGCVLAMSRQTIYRPYIKYICLGCSFPLLLPSTCLINTCCFKLPSYLHACIIYPSHFYGLYPEKVNCFHFIPESIKRNISYGYFPNNADLQLTVTLATAIAGFSTPLLAVH